MNAVKAENEGHMMESGREGVIFWGDDIFAETGR